MTQVYQLILYNLQSFFVLVLSLAFLHFILKTARSVTIIISQKLVSEMG